MELDKALFKRVTEKASTPTDKKLLMVNVEKIKENPYQPRIEMDEKGLEELMSSIEKEGLLQPVLLSPIGDGEYFVVAGHRRVEAFRRLGKKTIPAIVIKKQDEVSLASKAIAENFQREDLNPIELAMALERYKERFGKTLDEMALEIGKHKSEISRLLSLLNLPSEIVEEVRTKKTTKDVRSLYEINSYGKKLEKLDFSNFEIAKEQKFLYIGLLEQGREWLKREIKRRLSLLEEKEAKKTPIFIKRDKRRGVQINIRIPNLDEEKIKKIEEFISRTIE